MSDTSPKEHPALKGYLQQHRDEAYQNGWSDGYAEGYGKATSQLAKPAPDVTGERAPGHTDLMISPEAIDEALAKEAHMDAYQYGTVPSPDLPPVAGMETTARTIRDRLATEYTNYIEHGRELFDPAVMSLAIAEIGRLLAALAEARRIADERRAIVDDLASNLVNARADAKKAREEEREIDILFDGPPSHESGRFVEVESPPGTSISFGEWVDRGGGLWALRFRSRTDGDEA